MPRASSTTDQTAKRSSEEASASRTGEAWSGRKAARLEGSSRPSPIGSTGALATTAGSSSSGASSTGSRPWAATASVPLKGGEVPATLKASQRKKAAASTVRAGPKAEPA